MRRQFEIPAAIAAQAAKARARDPSQPREKAPVRDAVTVILLRDGRRGLETYLLRRQGSMKAFGGMTVFPGGTVDPADIGAVDVPWSGPPAVEWTASLSADEPLARGLIAAAVRETFEESGVLLAGPDDETVVGDTSTPEWQEAARALENRGTSLTELLTRHGLRIRADLLRPWSHWLTPEVEIRRFDTRFLLAALPPGQRTGAVAAEASDVAWVRPADAIAELDAGERIMVPPTAYTLLDLAEFATAADALKAAEGRHIERITPQLHPTESGAFRFVTPEDPAYVREAE
ncbi:NUDIX hydrolase [Fodinicola acaciae]|uniref:NUDIX hydrolase n=1 Tax=Fodinicola acaciae TaxID=2681555 RepID=UPI0013D55A08|nr:NUDIX domain-containing protein [Fodinicola acaciae]